jgi:hypothetical protein
MSINRRLKYVKEQALDHTDLLVHIQRGRKKTTAATTLSM